MNLFFWITQMQELMVENNDMRETLQNMQTELINLLNQQNNDYETNTEVRKKYLFIYLFIYLFSN